MRPNTRKPLLTLLIVGWSVFSFLGLALAADADPAMPSATPSASVSRAPCQSKALDSLKNLDKWIAQYSRDMQSTEPAKRAKYEEWLRELNKLKTLVNQSKGKLNDLKGCASDECVADQCSLVAIADQQVAQLIRETEEMIGETARFGEENGREVLLDADALGNNTLIDSRDYDDAQEPSASQASNSSSRHDENDTLVNGGSASNGTNVILPPTNPREEISPQ